jgi:hypothetical protein
MKTKALVQWEKGKTPRKLTVLVEQKAKNHAVFSTYRTI